MTDPGQQREQTPEERVIERLAGQLGILTAQLMHRDVMLDQAYTEIERLRSERPALPDDD